MSSSFINSIHILTQLIHAFTVCQALPLTLGTRGEPDAVPGPSGELLVWIPGFEGAWIILVCDMQLCYQLPSDSVEPFRTDTWDFIPRLMREFPDFSLLHFITSLGVSCATNKGLQLQILHLRKDCL